MAELFTGFWNALTAAGRLLALGSLEAWGFWSTTLLLLGLLIYLEEIAGGITWRLIEGRLRPKLRDKEAEGRLREEIRDLKVELYDCRKTLAQLKAQAASQGRLIEANRNWTRNWNADAHRATERVQ